MIVFGTAVTEPEFYDRYAVPGIKRTAEPDSVVLAHHTAGSVFRNYNLLLDMAAEHDDLEALVLLHQDVELVDRDFTVTVRKVLGDPDVAIVGCTGAVGVRSLAWWQGAVSWAGHTHRYQEYGGGEFAAISWRRDTVPSYAAPGEVDSVDGLVMVLSPWAVRELRFDESLGKLHGYDFDICMQAKAAGKKVMTADFRVIHHHSLELVKDPETWIQSYIRLAQKWNGRFPDTGADLDARAMRAEAEAAAARMLMVSWQMREQAGQRQLARLEQELDSTKAELVAAKQELDALRREDRQAPTGSDEPAGARPSAGRLAAIDYAVNEHGVQSFASLEIGQAYGQYAFYTIDQPTVHRGALIDAGARQPGDYLLSAIEYASERPGLRVLDGNFSLAQTVGEIGHVDTILLFEVLHRMIDPDWDQLLELYAPATSSFIIVNPQWQRGEATVRLIDLGREEYLAAVPPWDSHLQLFDHLADWFAVQQRPYMDATHVWQWGITDLDLQAKMSELGFDLDREWDLSRPADTDGFLNKAFVFKRP